jgi:curli biogenesis system outer membrane secretion channel CsgG
MAVMRFTNNTNAYWWKPGVGAELSDLLTNELASSKKFRMIERKEIDSVIGEIKFNQSGMVDKSTKVKLGKIKGAQYLVMATVTSFEEGTDEKGGGLSFMGIGVGGKSSKAYIAVDLKVVDTETSEIIDTRTIEATSESTSNSFSGGFMGIGASGDKKKKAPVGKAIRACVVNIAEYLECSMVDKNSECLEKYASNEKKRKEKTKSVIDLDE